MSILEINGTGYTEKELERNWAAEYARREIEQLRSQTDAELSKKKDLEEANREHTELAQQINYVHEHVQDLSEIKADKTQYASIDQAGLIKLYSSGGVNRSGLIVGTDGTTYVACSTNGGITRDGAGGLKITDGGVTSSRIGNGAVVTQKIADGAVTSEKLSDDLSIATADQIHNSVNGNHLITIHNAKYLSGEEFISALTEYFLENYDIAGASEFCDWLSKADGVPQLTERVDNLENHWTGSGGASKRSIDNHEDGIFQFYGDNINTAPYDHDGVVLQVDVEGNVHQVFFSDALCIYMRVKDAFTHQWSDWKKIGDENPGKTHTAVVYSGDPTDEPNTVYFIIDEDNTEGAINAVAYDNVIFSATEPETTAENWFKPTGGDADVKSSGAANDTKIVMQNGRLTVLKEPEADTTFLND